MRGPASWALLALVACARHPVDDSPPGNVTTSGVADTGHHGSGSGTASCPMLGAPGTFVASDELGPGSFDLGVQLAIDAAGDIAFARSGGGVEVLSPKLDVRFVFRFGTLVAFDASGNLFVVGAFSQPTDFGLGVVVPMGNIDVFVAELDKNGNVIFAKALGVCGADLLGAAIDRATGRIAISGSAMGTIVIDANGEIVFALDMFGKVAFDLHGNLVVAGSTGGNGFVAEIGDTGGVKGMQTFTSTGSIDVRALAVGPSGEIVLGGNFTGVLDLFGDRIDTVSGSTFLAKVDESGKVVLVNPNRLFLPARDLDAIAIDFAGHIVVAGDDPSSPTFGPVAVVVKLDSDGALVFNNGSTGGILFPIPLGEALAVAVNACGAIFVGDLAIDSPTAGGAMHSILFEIAP